MTDSMTEKSTDIQINHKIEDRILKSLKKRDGVATAGDVAADTGLGYDQTEFALRHMLTLYKSHLDVDDDGNLRYRFDPKFARRGSDPGRTWRKFKQGAWKAFMGFFKVWTMIMLVGYTVLFVLLLVAVGIAAFAATMQSDEGEGGGSIGILPFLLVGRFLEFMFWWNIFSSPQRSYGRGRRRRRRGMLSGLMNKEHKKPSKPFYQKIFHYLFGPDAQQKGDPLGPERAFAQFVRSRNGRITAAEWASRTGQNLDEAENALTASIVRFSGDVDVSDDGVLVYRFDELMVTAEEGERFEELPPIWQRKVNVAPFTGNKSSSNTWISVLNTFNLAMSGFILYSVYTAAATAALPIGLAIGLGWVPLIFSTLFFAVPLLRKLSWNKKKKKAERENERREALSIVFESARDGEARPVPDSSLPEEFHDGFLVGYDGDIEVTDEALTVFKFPRVAEEFEAGEQSRQSAADEVVFGKTVFSSDEDEKSLDDEEMEEFDRRLARELGGEVFELDFEQEAPAQVSHG